MSFQVQHFDLSDEDLFLGGSAKASVPVYYHVKKDHHFLFASIARTLIGKVGGAMPDNAKRFTHHVPSDVGGVRPDTRIVWFKDLKAFWDAFKPDELNQQRVERLQEELEE